MKKLLLTVFAVASLSAGAAFADADSQAGSAWRNDADYGPVPGTREYYNNSGGPEQVVPYGYAWGRDGRYYAPQARVTPAYPYARNTERASRRDRDGDGVVNSRDRYPNDPSRW